VCLEGSGTCAGLGEDCQVAIDCCSLLCVDLKCAGGSVCASVGEECSDNGQCCSNYCASGFCDPATMTCEEDTSECAGPWQACTTDGDCCGGLSCINGRCIAA
jgi:hypothetical protein